MRARIALAAVERMITWENTDRGYDCHGTPGRLSTL